jgi:lysophospholipase L1-like esterase
MSVRMAALVASVALAGCGQESPRGRTDEPAKPGGSTVLVAALGDSITAGSPAWDPDPGRRETLGTGATERSQYEYWAERTDPRLRFRNCGVFGDRTDQIARRLDECARAADVLIVQGGINDIAQMRRPAKAAERLREMVRRGAELGLRVAIADVLPWNNGHPLASPFIARLNSTIHALAREERAILLPFHATLEDPARPGRMRADWTADGDHPSVEGYRRLGEVVAERLAE